MYDQYHNAHITIIITGLLGDVEATRFEHPSIRFHGYRVSTLKGNSRFGRNFHYCMAPPKVVKTITSGASNDEIFVKMTTFPFQWDEVISVRLCDVTYSLRLV